MMSSDDLAKEQHIMVVMRRVLTTVIREITPQPGEKYPLSEETVQDIKMCLGLIVARERELAVESGDTSMERPYYTDEPAAAQISSLYEKKTEH